ncbi:hypothetical protein SAMN05518856_110199 [Paenibacillus sp. OK003]|nr:hypothetical protein SAMN05518856_110199 [Paenibacillus sp. OK003]
MKSKMKMDSKKFAYAVMSGYSSDKGNAEAIAELMETKLV